MPSDSEERSQRGRIGALARIAQEPSGAAMTEKARQAFRDSFYDKTDPELPAAERHRQAEAAYKLHMTRLSHKAALAKRRAADAVQIAIEAEAAACSA